MLSSVPIILSFFFFSYSFFSHNLVSAGSCGQSMACCTVSASRGTREDGNKEEGRAGAGLESSVRGNGIGQHCGLWLKKIFQILSAVERI